MKRVMIVGGPGSGKSTLARLLGEKTGLPVFHIDQIHWKPGWNERARHEKDALVHRVHIKDAWIFEGGHSSTYPERVARADTMIWLDLSVWLRFRRVIWRMIHDYGRTRPDMAQNCPERLGWEFVLFLDFIWRTRKTARLPMLEIETAAPRHLTIHHLKSPDEVAAFIDCLGSQDQAAASTAKPSTN